MSAKRVRDDGFNAATHSLMQEDFGGLKEPVAIVISSVFTSAVQFKVVSLTIFGNPEVPLVYKIKATSCSAGRSSIVMASIPELALYGMLRVI